jgi:hypothetical protein
MRHRKAVIAAIVVALASRSAAGDPVIHLKTPSTVHTDGGADLKLPPGYFLEQNLYWELDDEFKRLQTQETRLKAENKSLRESSSEYPWAATGLVGAFGIALGIFFATQLK